jgi:hypothetical protein
VLVLVVPRLDLVGSYRGLVEEFSAERGEIVQRYWIELSA